MQEHRSSMLAHATHTLPYGPRRSYSGGNSLHGYSFWQRPQHAQRRFFKLEEKGHSPMICPGYNVSSFA